jgi:methyl-accepting chemotaxis protein
MARAVDVFKQNMIGANRTAAEQAAARAARSRRQAVMEGDTEAFGKSVAAAMATLSHSSVDIRSAAEAMTRASATVHQAATTTSQDAVKSSHDLTGAAAARPRSAASATRQPASAKSCT